MLNLQTILAITVIGLCSVKSTCAVSINGFDKNLENVKPKAEHVLQNEKVLRRITRDLKEKSFDKAQFIYDLLPGESCIIDVLQSSIFLPTTQDNIIVVNIGNYSVNGTSLKGGVFSGLSETIQSATLNPGETLYYSKFEKVTKTGIEFKNEGNGRALFFAARQHEHLLELSQEKTATKIQFLDFDQTGVKLLLKFATALGGKSVMQDHHDTLIEIITTYWSPSAPRTWELILNDIGELVGKKVYNEIKDRLKVHMNPVEKTMVTIAKSMKTGVCTVEKYLNVIDNIQFLHEQATFSEYFDKHEEINYYTLPLYSHFVNLMNTIYLYGISFSEQIGLTPIDVTHVEQKIKDLTESAKTYIENMADERFRNTYNVGNPNYIYDDLMNVRTYMAVNGLSYLSFWKYASDPLHNTIDYTTLAYSEYYGRSSTNLYLMALHNINALQPKIVPAELVLQPVGNTREEMTLLRVHLGWEQHNTILGIDVFYDDEPMKALPNTRGLKEVDLTGRTIKKLEAGGNGMLDYIVLTLSDGEYIEIGKNIRKNNVVMELKHHHIAAIYARSECRYVSDQVCNIAVSYALDEIDYF